VVELQRVARQSIVVGVPHAEQRALIGCSYCGTRFHPNYHLRSFDSTRMVALFSDFELVELTRLGKYEVYPNALDRIRNWPGPATPERLPEFGLCPACGYREIGERQVGRRSGVQRSPAAALRRLAGHLIPKQIRFRWQLALYRRIRPGP
jgi:hypothetical protein